MNTNANVLNSIVTPVNLSQALNDAIGMYGYPNIGTDLPPVPGPSSPRSPISSTASSVRSPGSCRPSSTRTSS